MAQQLVLVGGAPNDGTGDPLRTAFTKVNANETEIYASGWPAGPIFNVKAAPYNAVADGTDQSVAFQAAFDAHALAGGGTILIPKGSYGLTRVLGTASNCFLLLEPGTVLTRSTTGSSQQGMIDLRGTVTATTTTLTSSAALAAVSLSVASEAGFTAGDYLEIESAATIGGQGPYLYEINVVSTTAAGTITLKYATRNAYSTSGPTVVTVRKIVPLRNIRIQGGSVVSAGGTLGDCVRLQHCVSPIIDGVSVSNFGDRGIVPYRCFGGIVRNCYATAGGDPTDSWGISLMSCEGMVVDNCEVRDHTWDGIDLVYGTMYTRIVNSRAVNCGDVGFVIGHGLHGHHNTVAHCTTVLCGAAGYALGNNTYAGDDDNTFIACNDIACQNHGFTVRKDSARNRFIGCRTESNQGTGFNAVDTTTVDTAFIGCTASRNTFYGFSIAGTGRLEGCIADSNTSAGVRLETGAGRVKIHGQTLLNQTSGFSFVAGVGPVEIIGVETSAVTNLFTGTMPAVLRVTPNDTVVSKTLPAGDSNDYDPATYADIIRFTGDVAGNSRVTGLINGFAGRRYTFLNVSANNVLIGNASAGSAAANRFTTTTGADLTLTNNQMAEIIYDANSTRWRAVKLP